MKEIWRALVKRGDSHIQGLLKWQKKHVKLAWTGGVGVLVAGILLTFGLLSSTSGSSTLSSTGAPNGNQVVAKPAEPTPVAAQPSNHDGLAAWIPLYPGSAPEITSSVQTPDGDQNVSTFKTDDAPTKVVSYFQDQLKTAGFNIKTASSGEESGTVQAEDGLKKRSLVLSVSTLPDEKGTSARVVTVERR